MSDKIYYLTKDGLEKVKKEREDLRKKRKEMIKVDSPEVFHSEEVNPEYLTFQKDLNILEERMAKLEDVIRNAKIIENPQGKEKKVQLGAEVTVDVGGQEDKLILVGTVEADPMLGKISNESPVGKALMGHKEGDEVTVSSPIQTVYKIKKIEYQKK
jgi:transcription elongation factor GreA